MNHKKMIATIAIAATLCLAGTVAQAFDANQYPDLKGMWKRVVGPNEKDDRKNPVSDDWLWSFPTNAPLGKGSGSK